MNVLLLKSIAGLPITDADIAEGLYDICESEHSSCNPECPVYAKNGNKPVNGHRPFKENRGCDCFKDGAAMLRFLRQ